MANFSSPLKASVATVRPLCVCKLGLDIGRVLDAALQSALILMHTLLSFGCCLLNPCTSAELHFAIWSEYAIGPVRMTAEAELQEHEIERPTSPSRVPHTVASIRPSVKYVEVEGPNKRFLRQALAPPQPVLPRKQTRLHAPPIGLRQRVPLSSSLTGK